MAMLGIVGVVWFVALVCIVVALYRANPGGRKRGELAPGWEERHLENRNGRDWQER